jgi:hypothetical protein
VLKFGSKCSFIPYKFRFLAEFCFVLPALMTFFNTLLKGDRAGQGKFPGNGGLLPAVEEGQGAA